MIVLEKDTVNEFTATCYEFITLTSPYYLVTFTDEMTNKEYKIVLTDTSEHPSRYQLFTLTLPADVSTMTNTGYYRYEIREQASSTNLNPDLSGDIVEEGRMKLKGTGITESIPDPTGDENSVHERE